MLAVILLALLAASSAEDRIYNGKEAEPDLDNVVYVVTRYHDLSGSSSCTGTVISEHYILTAAHCVPPSTKSVGIYTRDNHRSLIKSSYAPFYQSYLWIVHPDYKNIEGDDIALIRVPTPMTIPPVPLAANYSHPKDDWLRSAGYDEKDCFNASYLEERPHLNVICLGKSNSTLLPGDSGGPTFAQGKDGRFYQVGISSYIRSDLSGDIFWPLALEQPFTFLSAVTDVSYYCPWIEETTGGEVKCQTFEPTKIVPKF
uniref:Peptidase S1 domain-containing protein n=1 Tax=Panagrolaimus sp. JU765 TaxID=591449 RepID=A0AC34R8J0_9BILA